MKNLIWFLAGIIIPSSAFFILLNKTNDYWYSSEITSGITVVYLLTYMIINLRKPVPVKITIISFVVVLTLIFMIRTIWITQKATSQNSKESLLKVRTVIAAGILDNNIRKPFLKTLYEYHNQPGNSKSLKAIFEKVKEDSLTNARIKESEKEGSFIFVKFPNDNEIEIIGLDTIAKGMNKSFTNTNGQKGKLQYKALLTPKGIQYERQN